MSTQREQMIAAYLEWLSYPEAELPSVFSSSINLGSPVTHLIEHLDRYVEMVAESVHDAWSRTKVANGYTYGAVRNDDAQKGQLTHPLLVPYYYLSDVDKSYDVNTARTALEGLVRIWQEES